jgi:shikimate dehydrogenase
MKVFGLIGRKLDHSFSKEYFTQKFQKENISDAAFELFPLPQISEFKELLGLQSSICGLAVTIPYKEEIIKELDEVDTIALSVGAVNCIVFKEGRTKGYNTDIIGFEKSLLEVYSKNMESALVLGSGGASKAVQYILKKLNIPFKLVSRTKNIPQVLTYAELNEEVMLSHQLIVNCTPIGMGNRIDQKPDIPYQFINSSHCLFDLIYNPAETQFLKEGKARGAKILNGMKMLELQAEENWLLWNNVIGH